MTEAQILEKKQRNETVTKQAQRVLNAYSNIRLVMAVVVLFSAVAWFRLHQPVGLVIGIAAIAGFFWYVHKFNRQQLAIDFLKSQLLVLERYAHRYSGAWKTFEDDGAEFLDKTDHLSVDLDLFGPHSLYQYLNIGSTASGKEALARLLRQPSMSHIALRQHSVRELLADDDYVIRFEALGREPNKRRLANERKAEKQLKEFAAGDEPIVPSELTPVWYMLPVITVVSLVLSIIDVLPMTVPVVLVGVQLAPSILMAGEINRRKDALLQFQTRIAGTRLRLALLKKASFESAYLKKMQADIDNAENGMQAIERIANLWQLRENLLLYIPLCGFLMWDFHCLAALEKWRRTYGKSFGRWMDWIGEVEAMASLGTMGRINPTATVFPEILSAAEPALEMIDGKHPLIEPGRVVGNDYQQRGETVIITGSNMSGKSTFMRTLALNTVLAYAGGVVNAKSFRISPMRIFTSMRVQDDIGEGISTFYGEILRIKEMAEYAVTGQPMMVLIDEIFKGTNSADRIIGAQAAIRKLTQPWIMTVVTTHDFELCALVEEADVNGKNFHFQEHYRGDELLFDYIIRPGRCQTTNAQYLMRMAGLLDDPEKDKR